jgi:hypothetical protein
MKDRKLPCYSNATDYDKYIFWMGLTAEAFEKALTDKNWAERYFEYGNQAVKYAQKIPVEQRISMEEFIKKEKNEKTF